MLGPPGQLLAHCLSGGRLGTGPEAPLDGSSRSSTSEAARGDTDGKLPLRLLFSCRRASLVHDADASTVESETRSRRQPTIGVGDRGVASGRSSARVCAGEEDAAVRPLLCPGPGALDHGVPERHLLRPVRLPRSACRCHDAALSRWHIFMGSASGRPLQRTRRTSSPPAVTSDITFALQWPVPRSWGLEKKG